EVALAACRGVDFEPAAVPLEGFRKGAALKTRVILVDDERRILAGLRKALESMGYKVSGAISAEKGLELLESEVCDVMITDLVMPGMDGIELLREVKAARPDLPVIILTGRGTVETAVEAMKEGAFDYIAKPFNIDEVDLILKRAVEHQKLVSENIELKTKLEKKQGLHGLVGGSEPMQEVYRIIERVRNTDSTVMIVGESGTGKELISKAIHYTGDNAGGPFVTVDCAAIAETLLESELFGHVKGAFTGAHRDKTGYFEAARGGTIFLDEIGEFSYPLQTRLLRVLQDGEFSRVGDHSTARVAVRVIAATNRDLEQAVAEKRFREDLFYRLNVIIIKAPPLRARVEDVGPLFDHFLHKFSARMKRQILRVSDEVIETLKEYPWPGNARELENTVEQLVTFCDDEVIGLEHLPERILKSRSAPAAQATAAGGGLLKMSYKDAKKELIEGFTQEYIEALLGDCDGNVSEAAKRAGIDRACLHRLIKKHKVRKNKRKTHE
ncbi:MAG: sigma-54 dependent transcriptional regulator, partial [bacterium]